MIYVSDMSSDTQSINSKHPKYKIRHPDYKFRHPTKYKFKHPRYSAMSSGVQKHNFRHPKYRGVDFLQEMDWLGKHI